MPNAWIRATLFDAAERGVCLEPPNILRTWSTPAFRRRPNRFASTGKGGVHSGIVGRLVGRLGGGFTDHWPMPAEIWIMLPFADTALVDLRQRLTVSTLIGVSLVILGF